MTSGEDSASKPSSPPPAYTELPDSSQYLASASQPRPSSNSTSPSQSFPSPIPHHPSYGPTPIAQQTHLLPYYDLRSNYAIAESTSRARWRFAGALIWALVILLCVGILLGAEPGQMGGRDDPGQFHIFNGGNAIARLDRWRVFVAGEGTWKDR